MRTIEIVKSLAESTINSLGYELIDVEFKKEQADWVLTLFIDKLGGIMLDDCEAVSRAVEPILDEADPIEQSYFLSVSSPGLDRPLKTTRDFERNLSKTVIIKLYAQIDKKKEFTGTILAFTESSVTLLCDDGKERVFLLKDIAQAKPYIEFKF